MKYCVLRGCRQAQKMVSSVFLGLLLPNYLFFPQHNLFFSVQSACLHIQLYFCFVTF